MQESYSVAFRVFRLLQHSLRGSGLGKIVFLRKVRDRLYRMVRPRNEVTLNIQGVKMVVDPAQSGVVPDLLRDGVFEKGETMLLHNLLQEGDVFVDVGGNIGYYTLIAASIVGKSGRVFSFEPEPVNFQWLKRNVELNGFSSIVHLEQKALSNRTEGKRLYLHGSDTGSHHLYDPGSNEPSLAVEAVALDDYFGDTPPPISVLKMDIEGFEPFAVEGMHRTIRKNPQAKLLMEFYPAMMIKAGADPTTFLKKIKALGYSIHLIDEVSDKITEVTDENLLGYCETHLYANLLCLPKE